VWRLLAERIRDDATNANNRWGVAAELNRRLGAAPGPFWNCPGRVATAELCVTKGVFPHVARDGRCLAEYRIVDERLRHSKPTLQSVWKLYTAGSVGSQTLLGIPRLHALRTEPRLAPWSRVWPFETGFAPAAFPERGPFVLHAEAWPRIVPEAGDPGMVRDARQVVTLARHFADLDTAGKLAALFERPTAMTGDDVDVCCDEEGWIVGAH
jgi:precorrin-8X/cobalt-precorrin-8 methylmutase